MSKPITSIAAYGVSLVLSRGITLLMLPFITHHLAPAELGKLELLASFGALFGVAISLCLHEALYRYAGCYRCIRKQFIVANRIMLLSIISGFLLVVPVALLLLPVGKQVAIETRSILLVCCNLAFTGPLMISTAWLRMQDKVRAFTLVSLGATLVQVAIIVTSLRYSSSIDAILAASLIATLLQLIIFQYINRFFWRRLAVSYCRRYLSYSLPLVLAGAVAFGINGAEKWVLALAASVEELALYAIAAKFALALCLLIQPFGMWWMPKRFGQLKSNISQAANITEMGLVYICLVAVTLCFVVPLFIQLALDVQYHNANQLLGVVLLIAVCKEFSELLNIGILLQKRTQWLLAINCTSALLGISFSVVLVEFSMLAMIYGLLVVAIIRLGLINYLSQRCLAMPYRPLFIVTLFTLTSLCVLTSPMVETLHWRILLTFIAPAMILLFVWLSGSNGRRIRSTSITGSPL